MSMDTVDRQDLDDLALHFERKLARRLDKQLEEAVSNLRFETGEAIEAIMEHVDTLMLRVAALQDRLERLERRAPESAEASDDEG